MTTMSHIAIMTNGEFGLGIPVAEMAGGMNSLNITPTVLFVTFPSLMLPLMVKVSAILVLSSRLANHKPAHGRECYKDPE